MRRHIKTKTEEIEIKKRIDTMKKGLLVVFTGHGKGKTTAALGCAVRALGHNCRVGMVQFVKGSWKSGELESMKRFKDLMDIHTLGKGFMKSETDIRKNRRASLKAWQFTKKLIESTSYQILILDELTYLINYKIIKESEVLDVLVNRPLGLHLIVTGRNAPQSLIEAADLVTEMKEIKHPLDGGITSQKGIEF
jgi:cob(I)alamin adenosyltransferase